MVDVLAHHNNPDPISSRWWSTPDTTLTTFLLISPDLTHIFLEVWDRVSSGTPLCGNRSTIEEYKNIEDHFKVSC